MSSHQAELPARQSQNVAVDLSASDGDTWLERIAVCESATLEGKPKLLLRSYYRNSRTNEKAWDEPPSGASQIKHATPEMRQKAELQMQELQLTLELIPDDTDAQSGSANDGADKKNKKKGGLFARFRGNSKKKEKAYLSESKDLNLQKAIARSMADQRGKVSSDEPIVYYDPEGNGGEHDEALEMAKALSMSETPGATNMTEDEMLRQALEASRLEANAVAAAPKTPPVAQNSVPKEEQDRKMPARSDFDPYA